jgi:hypothetical protein
VPIDEMVCSTALRAALSFSAVHCWDAADCAEVIEELSLTAKAVSGVVALAAARLASLDSSKGPDWLARKNGISSGAARKRLDTAKKVDKCPSTKAGLQDGTLSLDQADEIASTEDAVPGSEPELLDLAKKKSLGELKERARDIRLGSVDPEDLHKKQQGLRSVRKWVDRDGMHCGTWKLPPETGVAFGNRLDAETDRVFREAHQQGRVEPREAYAADAFVRMFEGVAKRGGTDMVIVADRSALERGHVLDGEVCHIIGGAPIPVSVAVQLAQDAFVKAVIHDGVQVETIKHYGRHINAELRTILGIGDPPWFPGPVCVDCGAHFRLQIDHVDPVANNGATCATNLEPRCPPCHAAKTERDRNAGLLGQREQMRDRPRAGPGAGAREGPAP